jgi:broad specificity phosphatase PhoE
MVRPVRLYLVRHGRAAASFGEARDPGLDAAGAAQAEAAAGRLAPLGPLPIVVSPLRRTRETAAPLERLWRRTAQIEPAVAEIPSPDCALDARADWLRGIMVGRWGEQAPDLQAWRVGVLAALAAIPEPSVVVSHFVAINVAVGHAEGDDRVIAFWPDHCSVTILDAEDGRLRLVERGAEGATRAL